jgi:deoxyribodipyrimidine photolyase
VVPALARAAAAGAVYCSLEHTPYARRREAAVARALRAGVRLGADYPRPIVDHATARERALARFQEASARRS